MASVTRSCGGRAVNARWYNVRPAVVLASPSAAMVGTNLQPKSSFSKRYELLADEIARQITGNVLRPGDRLPSIREACEGRQMSPSTVFQAYYLLESRGLIRAEPRSGYFVNPLTGVQSPEPAPPAPRDGTYRVDIADLIWDVLASANDPQIVPLGGAYPSPTLFPLDILNRSLSSSARQSSIWSAVNDLPPGHEALRRQIEKRYLMQGVEVSADEIVLTNGALEALNLCLEAVARPGDAVAVESPCFYATLQALQRREVRAIEVPTDPHEGVELSSLAHILETERPKACWLMTNFQNPLGCSMPQEKKSALVDLLARYDTPLIEDDVYGELQHDGKSPASAKTFDRRGLVMHCSSFSKTLAPGYRVGWVAAGRFAPDLQRLKLMTSLSGSIPAQAALADYLQQGGYDRHLRHLREALKAQKEALVEAVTRHFPPGTRLTRPDGGYFVWVDMPWDTVDALKLHDMALAEKISIAPGPMFSSHGEFRRCLRLNFGYPWNSRLEQAIATLGQLATAPRY
jgi:DNA-binding transcriptional MocR family regulator